MTDVQKCFIDLIRTVVFNYEIPKDYENKENESTEKKAETDKAKKE